MGGRNRWRTMPWLVVLFGVMIVPLGAVSIFFIIIQPILIGTWCTLCLFAAVAMLIQIPYSVDELVATGQFLAERRRQGKSVILAFLRGDYQPTRPLCLLTFDDGLREHFTDVTPILAERNIPGQFFVITSCVEEQVVAAVHKNHFLTADLGFAEYQRTFLDELRRRRPDVELPQDAALVARTYRWDTPEVAAFKYLLNFLLDAATRDQILDTLFRAHFGSEAEFARQLYLSWPEAVEMQAAGMVLGGHTHAHQALATLTEEAQLADLTQCMARLRRRLGPQALWPFSYPFGKRTSFQTSTPAVLREAGFCCSFATEVGDNRPGEDIYCLRRIDPKDVPSTA
jgi:peptidoglycan/xylan/chitin deacetylase (PgdA/CDA1 family)